ncbi:PP2C family protein-serine/threonine phosphatase [Treponema sp. SP13]|uniref:PP2C family protein-serine/threonine phosphatase n=1 Tax=Treponema sp. SP13 TaxID=2789742 RepID=UPI003D92FEB6
MAFVILNFALSVFFIWFSFYTNYVHRTKGIYSDRIVSDIVLATILSLLLTAAINLPFGEGVFLLVAKLLFFIEAVFLTNISFYFILRRAKRGIPLIITMMVILFAFALYIVFMKFQLIVISADGGIKIVSQYIFSGELANIFTWTWLTVFIVLYRFVLPGACVLIMLLLNEYRSTRLERYLGYLELFSVLFMWAMLIFLNFLSQDIAGFYLFYPLAYEFLLLMLLRSESVRAMPSASDALVYMLRLLFAYIIPSVFLVAVFTLLFPIVGGRSMLFYTILVVGTTLSLVFIWGMSKYLTTTRRLRPTDYEAAFGTDLASIDYSGEMDEIIMSVYNMFTRNVQCSSMSVFVNSGEEYLENAFSSATRDIPVRADNPAFDALLNAGRNVIALSEIDARSDIAEAREELAALFADTHSDALILLSEGHNLLGCITLGLKTSGEHYTAYDISILTRLYSYFFVFGYYMRNISNREIIGTVNREIRMSSQIIASIQEDVDAVKNPKADVGYIMKSAHNIGGEFIDLIRINDRTHLFVIGSLSGQGIAASMNMVILKSVIRTFLDKTHDFKMLVQRVNLFIRENLPKGSIFNGTFALVDFSADVMYYINCGIPAIFVYTQSYNNIIEIQGRGHVLGFVRDIAPYISVRQIKLTKGDIVLSCTNGVLTSRSLRGDVFGKERVQQVMLSNLTFPASRMAQFVYDNLVKFMSKEIEADVSALVIKYV